MSGPSRQPEPRALRWYVVLAVLVGLSAWYYLRPAAYAPIVIGGPIMGTTYTVKVVPSLPDGDEEKLAAAIKAALDDVNTKMSTYIPTSEVSRFATARAGVEFPVSAETAEVIEKSIAISDASGGAFDVTVRPLVDAWGFGPDGRPERKPDTAAMGALLARVGYKKLKLDRARNVLSKTTASVSVDLSAIAKGYAVDRVADAIEHEGYFNYLIEVGGEMRAKGNKADGEPWRVGIEGPQSDGARRVIRVVQLADQGMATSGNYRNFYVVDGVRYVHTIDPKSGAPVRHRLQSVSVIHPEAAMADGWATAFMVLGEGRAMRLAEEHGIAALFMITGEGDAVRIEMTKAFEPFIVRNKGS